MNRFLEHGKSDGFFLRWFPHGEEPMPMLNALGAPRVEYLGNLKYYADRLRVDDAKKQSLRGYWKEDRVWDAVSIHAPNFLLQVHSHLKKEANAKSFILAVRHLYRMEDIKTLCKNMV